MKFELAEIVTKDKLVHQGICYTPVTQGKKAILWVHGLTSKFYSDIKLMNLFAQACNEHGMGFAAFNNRGHDYLAGAHRMDPKSKNGYVYETIGSSVENFTECIQDIDAAVAFFRDKGYSRVILVGHSSGASKVCYYAGGVKDGRVGGVVLAGPMSDRYSAEKDTQSYERQQNIVKQKIREGKGDELLLGVGYFPLTPKRWENLKGEKSPEDVFNYRDSSNALATYEKIKAPLCVVLSGNDEHADKPIEQIRKAFDEHARAKSYKSSIVSGADHGFTGKEEEFVSTVIDWVTSL